MSLHILGVECIFSNMNQISPSTIQSSRGSEDMLYLLYIIEIRLKKGMHC